MAAAVRLVREARRGGDPTLKRALLIVPVPALALIWWLATHKNTTPEIPFAKARREELISTLPTNGKVEPIEWTAIRFDSQGLVLKVPVHEGQTVSKGTLIAQISEPGLNEELRAAEARAEQIRNDLETLKGGGRSSELTEIENSLSKAKFNLAEAQREYNSLRRLQEKQAATAVDMNAAHGRVREAEIEIDSLQRKRAALVSKADVSTAQARLREAESSIRLAQVRLAQGAIRSPMAGVIYSLPVRPGTYLNPGDPVASVGKLDRLRIRVYVDEPELGRVGTGQPVRITWDALPGREWEGSVEKKPTEVSALGTRQVGEVLCTIDNPSHELVPGTNVNAFIRTNVVSHALTIPKEAVRREQNGVGVFVLRVDRVKWQPIKLGVSSVTRAEVAQGLHDDEAVALPADHPLKDNDRVTPVYP